MRTIPLREAIDALRAEIIEATEEAQDEKLKFRLTSIEMEFHVLTTREGTAKLGFNILAGPLGELSGSLGKEQTQTVKLFLNPAFVSEESGGVTTGMEQIRYEPPLLNPGLAAAGRLAGLYGSLIREAIPGGGLGRYGTRPFHIVRATAAADSEMHGAGAASAGDNSAPAK